MVETIAVIPARGGSKRLPRKNIKMLNGKPMVAYTIDAVLNSNIDRCIVSTEDAEIRQICLDYGAEVIDRPMRLAEDSVTADRITQHTLDYLEENEYYKPDYVFMLLPTSPLIKTEDLNKSLNKIVEEDGEKLISAYKLYHPAQTHCFHQRDGKVKPFDEYQGHFFPYEQTYWSNFTIMIFKGTRPIRFYDMNLETLIYEIDEDSAHDVDTLTDFRIAETLLKEREKSESAV